MKASFPIFIVRPISGKLLTIKRKVPMANVVGVYGHKSRCNGKWSETPETTDRMKRAAHTLMSRLRFISKDERSSDGVLLVGSGHEGGVFYHTQDDRSTDVL